MSATLPGIDEETVMKTWMTRFVLVAISLMFVGAAALAAEPTNPAPEPSSEQRHKMAEIHQRMADCLVSERPMSECRAEMQKSCQSMGREDCSMMGGGMGPGMMGVRGMMQPPVKPSAPNP
jgi:hypothetical protein